MANELSDPSFRLATWVHAESYELHVMPPVVDTAPSPLLTSATTTNGAPSHPYSADQRRFSAVATITCRLDEEARRQQHYAAGGGGAAAEDSRELVLHGLDLDISSVTLFHTCQQQQQEDAVMMKDDDPSSTASVLFGFSPASNSFLCEPQHWFTAEVTAPVVRHSRSETVVLTLPRTFRELSTSRAGIFHPGGRLPKQEEGALRDDGIGFFVLRVAYTGVLHDANTNEASPSSAYGLFRCNTQSDPNFMLTHLEPTNARRLYPCFDEPAFKATFRVTVDFDASYQVVSGTCIESETNVTAINILDGSAANAGGVGTGGGDVPLTIVATPQESTIAPPPPPPPQRSHSNLPHNIRRHSSTTNMMAGTDPAAPNNDAAMMSSGPTIVRRTVFKPTPLLSSYLVSFAIGKFHMLQQHTKRRGLLCRVLFPTTDALNEGWYALDLLTKAIDFYEDFFQYCLPLEKLDIVGVTEFSVLGMENWGMMAFFKDFLLVSETTPIERRQRIARLIGHEVAHQWYGNLISVSWWNHLWLKEGFCRYLEFFFVNHVFPQWSMWGEFMTLVLDEALLQDCRLDKTHPVESCSSTPRTIFDSFDVISYGKGASLLRMLASTLGEDRLEQAIQALVRQFIHSSFSKADFLKCLEEAVEGDDVKVDMCRLIVDWVTVSGHPLVIIHRDDEGSAAAMAENSADTTPRGSDASAPASGASDGLPVVTTVSSAPLNTSVLLNQTTSDTSPVLFSATQHRSSLSADEEAGSGGCPDPQRRRRRHLLRVSQYEMPDLSSGILPHYLRLMQAEQRRSLHVADDVAEVGDASTDDVTLEEHDGQNGSPSTQGEEQADRSRRARAHSNTEGPDKCKVAGGPMSPTPRKRDFLWSPSDVLKPSTFVIPLTVLDLVHGQSSVRRNVVLDKSRCVLELEHDGEALTYINYCAAAVARCDYDVVSWLRVFEYSPFLTVQDRLAITMSLFRLRTLHIGRMFADEPQDRCTLLLEWLVQLSRQKTVQSTLWRYLTEQLEVLLYLLRDHPCWGVFADFAASMYHHALQLGLVSFHTIEKAVDFQAHGSVSAQTTMHILQNLAVCKSLEMLPEAEHIVDWALSCVLQGGGGRDVTAPSGDPMEDSCNNHRGDGGSSNASSSSSTPTHRFRAQPQNGGLGSSVSASGCVLPRTPSVDNGTPSGSPQPNLAVTAAQLNAATVESPNPVHGSTHGNKEAYSAHNAAFFSRPFDVRVDADVTKTTIAMQMVTEVGDVQRWWQLASVLAVALNRDINQYIGPNFIARHQLLPVSVEAAEMEYSALVRNRWINILAAPVFAMEDPGTFAFSMACIHCFTALSAPVAKAILRNTKLVTALLENYCYFNSKTAAMLMRTREDDNGESADRMAVGVRNGLLHYASGYCSNLNIMSLFKASLLGLQPSELAMLSPRSGGDDTPLSSKAVPCRRTMSGDASDTSTPRMSGRSSVPLGSVLNTRWPSTVTPAQAKHMQRLELNCTWVDYVSDHYNTFLKAKRKEGAWSGNATAAAARFGDSDPPTGSIHQQHTGGVSI